jgi:hypothetical protein
MAHQTIRDSERLDKLSNGLCNLDDVEEIIARVVAAATLALTMTRGGAAGTQMQRA